MKYHIPSFFLTLLLVGSCTQPAPPSVTVLSGQTMGTTYQVSYPENQIDPGIAKAEIDSILVALNASVSTYIPTSLISRINADSDTSVIHNIDGYFAANFISSRSIYEATAGAFNPAIGPLVEAYGFGAEEPQTLSQEKVDALRSLVDFESFRFNSDGNTLQKTIPGSRLDFSAIAKGMGVDLVGQYLEEKGVENYFVEIGGEVRTRGQHPENRPWRLGIDRPEENANPSQRSLQAIIPLADNAVATSGNYRNFYVKDGKKYVHTINPATGQPEISNLLSATVMASTCTIADGYATAFMVLGQDKAMEIVENNTDLEAYFISVNENGEFVETFSTGFPEKLNRICRKNLQLSCIPAYLP